MSILNAFDESEEILKAKDMARDKTKLPEIAIVTFKQELIDEVDKDSNWERCGLVEAGSIIPIYKTKYNNKEVAIIRTLMGAPMAAAMMEELISRGVKKFIFFGSCGTLSNEIPPSCFILPEEAYRDEGTSYHYLPASDFIDVSTVDKLKKIFDEENIKYMTTKVWTTDALFKETINKVKSRREMGCLAVDMECSAIMAVARARGVEAYQFLYTDDTLDGIEWDARTILDDRTALLKICLDIALKVSLKI